MDPEIIEYCSVSHSLFQRLFRRPPKIIVHEAIKLPDDFCDKSRIVSIDNVLIDYSIYGSEKLTGIYISCANNVKYEKIHLLFTSDSVITTDKGSFLKLNDIKRIANKYNDPIRNWDMGQVETNDIKFSGNDYTFTKNVNVREKVIYAIFKLK